MNQNLDTSTTGRPPPELIGKIEGSMIGFPVIGWIAVRPSEEIIGAGREPISRRPHETAACGLTGGDAGDGILTAP
jgi:hypothetical protein